MTRNIIVWDIETVANEKARDYFSKKKFKAPANYKDAQKIEEYITAERHKEISKAALSWWTGQIVCISYRWLHGHKAPMTVMGPDEKEIISRFFDMLSDEDQLPLLIGKNADVFDRPYIIGRAMAHQIGIPQALRPYRPVEDVNQIFGFSARCDQISKLSDYAFGLGIPEKSGHGTDVQHWFDQAALGDETGWSKIGDYCGNDVDIVHTMLGRWLTPYLSRTLPGLVPGAPPAAATEPPASELEEDDIPFGKPVNHPIAAIQAPEPGPLPYFDEMEFD